MRKTVIFSILLTFVVGSLLLGGCIPSQTQLRMEQDQQEMKRRLAEIERRVLGRSEERAQETGARLETLSRRLAEQQAALDTLRVDLQTINGRLEDMSRENNALRDNMDLIRDDLDLRLSALEDRLSASEQAGSSALRAAQQPIAEGGGVKPAAELSGEPKSAAQDSSPKALYEQGRDAILRNGEFARGRETLGKFLQQYPDHELAVNALYWIGEAYYGEKKYENAILQFQDVIEKYSDHPKSAAAMLKQALAFDALGDRDNALVILRRVGERYPLSEEARKAEEFLDKWS
ncbi:tol-pal system protein YbgF [Geoalkalibacter subterraneus]|uniref:tol-pal system protein YbgF n=1 Tax=Geoalkalibacter subterraneus TaxID=483547 RepID=UPI000693E05F|nr:tol-pal system protein YbgF [Geoalkalibacter subterraneus]